MSTHRPIGLFQAFGVELEYMIVDADTLYVRPIADEVLRAVAGEYVSDIEDGDIAWSNELALHVIELKTNGPAASLSPLADAFQREVSRVNETLREFGARLLPTAMHPWMDPERELRLWPHDHNPVYEAFDRIFDCRGHGWANLQSVHLNLPFDGDDEFGRLHAAIRLVLPILPALAASSPFADGRATGFADYRMEVYRGNARRVPSVSGSIIPEPVYTRQSYERDLLGRVYRDIAPLDPDGILQHEWLNARGAIARFDRGTIEIRVLDVQEHPAADLALCQAATALVRALVEERWTPVVDQQRIDVEPLATIFRSAIRDAERATIVDPVFLRQLGRERDAMEAGELWSELLEDLLPGETRSATLGAPVTAALDTILREGPLARRIERAVGGDSARLAPVYRELADRLERGESFHE